MTDFIITKENNGVFIIILNRFEKKTHCIRCCIKRFVNTLIMLKRVKVLTCILIHGNEKCFCASNVLQNYIESAQGDSLIALDFVNIHNEFNNPIIAVVAGNAVDISTTLLLHCNITNTSENLQSGTVITNRKLICQASQMHIIENEGQELPRLVNTLECKAILTKLF